jgi:hypothetical protein
MEEVTKDSSYEEVETYVDGLLDINPDNLDAEALKAPRIFTKLNRIYVVRSRKLAELYTQLSKLEHARRRHFGGKGTAESYKKEPLNEAILKQDIDSYLNIDPLMIEMRSAVKEEDRIVKFLEDAKGQLRSRGFDIKNAIEYRKLMMGM